MGPRRGPLQNKRSEESAMEKPNNFLTEIIDADLAEGRVKEIHTRFPPEPNG